jgi:hypothetical protein
LCLIVLLAKYGIIYTLLLAIPVYFWQFLTYWPKEYLIPYGIFSYLIHLFWIWFNCPHIMSTIFIFHQICYYLKLRFVCVNELLENFSKLKNPINRSNELIDILHKHNQICETVAKYNKFWCFEILVNVALYSFFVMSITYIGFFSHIELGLKLFFGSFALILISCFFCVLFSAAFVAIQVLIIEFLS